VTSPLLLVSGEYPPDVGGVGDYTERLRTGLDSLGWQSRVLSRRQVRRWDARSLVALVRAAPRAGVVHIQYQAAAYDLLGDVCLMPTLLRRLRPRTRIVTTFHDARPPFLFPKAGLWREKSVQLLARMSHAVVAADARDLAKLGGPSPRHHHMPIGPNVVCAPPPGYDRLAFRIALGLAPETLAVVYFGLRNASKGLDLLLEAFNLVAAQHPNARLVLLGGEVGASDPTDRKTAHQLRQRLDERVLQTGWLPPAQVSAYLLACDVALLPYADGASPRRGSLLACAEHGLPIVSTLPAAAEVSDAIQAVESNPHRLAEAVLHLAQDSADTARLRDNARALVTRASWPRIAQAHVEMYEQLGARLPLPLGEGGGERCVSGS
jgi:glycosyltransferase involved in cell wall biosynthesis